jgi:outer membrane lipoprotein SlyB
LAWTFVAVIFIAETGINYHFMKKGLITKKEFKKRMKLRAVGTVGGLACASGGAALGFLAGSAAFPVVGSIVGVILGGFAGGLIGNRLSVASLNAVERRIKKARERKRK